MEGRNHRVWRVGAGTIPLVHFMAFGVLIIMESMRKKRDWPFCFAVIYLFVMFGCKVPTAKVGALVELKDRNMTEYYIGPDLCGHSYEYDPSLTTLEFLTKVATKFQKHYLHFVNPVDPFSRSRCGMGGTSIWCPEDSTELRSHLDRYAFDSGYCVDFDGDTIIIKPGYALNECIKP